MKITPPLLQALRTDINAALVAVGAKHAVALDLGRCNYSELNATFKLDVSAVENGVPVSKEEAYLRNHYPQLGLKEEHLTQVFSLGGHSYTLAGYRNTGANKPFTVRRAADDKLFIMTTAQIERALGLASSSLIA